MPADVAAPAPQAQPDVNQALAARLGGFGMQPLRREFAQRGAFLHMRDFLTPEITTQLIAAVESVKASVYRNYLPGHKQGGCVSRHVMDGLAPVIAELYRSAALIDWLGQLAGKRLQVSPPKDPHAYARYFYTLPGDHIGWHYDTSYYVGRRYTLLLGIIDDSSCRLDYELHTREKGAAVVPGSVLIPSGGMVFFDGDKLRHRITPLGAGEVRVSLAFEYVTDPRMHPYWRLISNMKDSVAYFGFRQGFRRPALTRPVRGGSPHSLPAMSRATALICRMRKRCGICCRSAARASKLAMSWEPRGSRSIIPKTLPAQLRTCSRCCSRWRECASEACRVTVRRATAAGAAQRPARISHANAQRPAGAHRAAS
jgi:hypothetical protein